MHLTIQKSTLAFAFICGGALIGYTQTVDHTKAVASSELQWHFGDPTKDQVVGTSATKAYDEILANKKGSKIIVAIIDSGTESFHPDLAPNIWKNTDEIAGNGMDDDKNGYIDDIHGWSFIGGAKGDVDADLLEFTRIYKGLHAKYKDVAATSVAKENKKEYERYLAMKKNYEERMAEAKKQQAEVNAFSLFYEMANKHICEQLKKDKLSFEDVLNFTPQNDTDTQFKEMMVTVFENDLASQISDWKEATETQLKYQLNLEFDPRSMVGDNYANTKEQFYGNNHIDGPSGDHGTHVAGIVGANRNGFGINGLAENAELMIIRCVPNGDERDKDVANAIRYAVDNGAKIINMSFGKSFSPEKFAVDEAVRYAESKGVLLIHAAGNDAKNIDVEANFPSKFYENGKACKTWIEVGASGPDAGNLRADFSNYGAKEVDLFAPGVDIYSTVPNNSYEKNSGTSMAAPVTAGVAAALWSYYPNLTAKDVKAILMKSTNKYGKTSLPHPTNPKKTMKFKKMSISGGVVNLYNALQLAATWESGSAK
jgi:cell wall-associated protease